MCFLVDSADVPIAVFREVETAEAGYDIQVSVIIIDAMVSNGT